MGKIKKIEGYECPQCNELHDEFGGAVNCCEPACPEFAEKWKCLECDELYEDEEDAKSCC